MELLAETWRGQDRTEKKEKTFPNSPMYSYIKLSHFSAAKAPPRFGLVRTM